tara:strand:- start:1619 stop:2191 length:573 start_codon:yes stop_codon:yes gene_type:complete
MPTGKIYTYDPKINFDITKEQSELKQFSNDNVEINSDKIWLCNGPVDYKITKEKQEITNLDEPEPEITNDIEQLNKSTPYIQELMSKVKTPNQIDKYCENFEEDINDKRKSLSFLNVKNEKEGADWYKQNFPKLPDEFAEIMGRWNWGDLSQMTKKTAKNDKKKIAKGNKKLKEKYDFNVKQGNFVVNFD